MDIAPQTASSADSLDLAGRWRFATDPSGRGEPDRWFDLPLPEAEGTVELPGTTDSNGRGVPQHDDPELWGGLTRAFTYQGPAWYQRDVEVPAGWGGRPATLRLERVQWRSTVWVNGRPVGSDLSLGTPHVYEVGEHLLPGQTNRITVRVDNREQVPIGFAVSHSTTDWTQTNWNGVVGRIDLQAAAAVRVGRLRAAADFDAQVLRVTLEPRGGVGVVRGRVMAELLDGSDAVLSQSQQQETRFDGGPVSLSLPIAGLARWDCWTPVLHRLRVRVEAAGADDRLATSTHELPIGLRDLRVRDKRLLLNGRRVMLRGTLECCVFPLTGHPPMDPAPWRRVFRLLRERGLNHVRFHTWTPPEAAFVAADEWGMLLQVELPAWATVPPGSALAAYLRDEGRRVLDAYGHHPSFAILAVGNEIDGDWATLESITADLKAHDGARRLFTSHANNRSPMPLPSSDLFVTPYVQNQGIRLGGDMESYGRKTHAPAVELCPVPLVTHEMGQCAVHPDFSEIPKYHGVLRPYNLVRMREQMRRHGTLDDAGRFKLASGRPAWALSHKADIEACLATPGHGGFQLLQVNDFPGQGEALVGMFDAFWDDKGVIDAATFRGCCDDVVPLLRFDRNVWSAGETFAAEVLVNNHGPAAFEAATVRVTLLRTAPGGGDERMVREFVFTADLPQGEVTPVGSLEVPIDALAGATPAPVALRAEVVGTTHRNAWRIWVYPRAATPPRSDPRVRVCDDLDAARDAAAAGGTVLLTLGPAWTPERLRSALRAVFSPVFWSKRNIPTLHPGNMGLVCDPTHPAFRDFPTDFWGDWQWGALVRGALALDLEGQPAELRPLVTCIDDFHRGRRMAYLLEGRVGAGRLMVCGFDLSTTLHERPAARTLRDSLVGYLCEPPPRPLPTLDLERLLSPRATLGARVVRASSEMSGFEAARAIDGDWLAGWSTPTTPDGPGYPHELVIDLGARWRFAGVRYVPFQQKPRTGVVRRFELFVSDDGGAWGEPALRRTQPRQDRLVQELRFTRPLVGRFVRFVALEGFAGCRHAAIGELELLDAVPLDAAAASSTAAPAASAAAPPGDGGDRYVVDQI